VDAGNRLDVFLHMSTDEVYGSVNDDEPPRVEHSLFQPSNPYAASKAAAEMICHGYFHSFKIPLIIVRCNNAISKYQHDEKLIPRIIYSILNNEDIPIHGEGKSKRTFIHAYDISDAIETIINKGVVGKVYNIGSEMEYSVMDVVKVILGIMRPGSNITDWIKFIPDRAFQDYRYSIDTSALKSLGWTPKMSFDDAVRNVIAHKGRIFSYS
jgi:dTDP-glucose 4,6-dehydratase